MLTDDELLKIYQTAYDEHAGPPEFRHSVNFDQYHLAGLRGFRAEIARLKASNAELLAVLRRAAGLLSWPTLSIQERQEAVACINEAIANAEKQTH